MRTLVRSRLILSIVVGAACGCASTSPPSAPQRDVPTIHRMVADASVPANRPRAASEKLGRGEYMELESELRLNSGPDIKADRNWNEPIFGARMTSDPSDDYVLGVREDTGGFDLGGGSDTPADLIVQIGWRFGAHQRVWLGYSYPDIDYDDGHGSDEFEFEFAMEGPVLGVDLGF